MKKLLMILFVMIFSISLTGCSEKGAQDKNSDEEDNMAVAALVESFGNKLQQVSLLAPPEDLKKNMEENYGGYLTSELLTEFLNDPDNAPGKLTSSPWPDRIEITSTEKTSEGLYEVTGTIIEVTSTEQGTENAAAKRPITLEVKKVDGEWLISSVVLGNYEAGDSIKYRNRDYGFTFTLPKSWSGYTIVAEAWEGRSVEGSISVQITETGPKLLIRHPKWTKENPREDIPVMVFNMAQWDKVQQGKISLGAAPIGPAELGRNTTYVFALPARYNYDFLTGYQEVEQILTENPLKPFNLQ